MVRYLEDFEPGQRFGSSPLLVDAAHIKSFATEFDPQPFHLDEDIGATPSKDGRERLAYRGDDNAPAGEKRLQVGGRHRRCRIRRHAPGRDRCDRETSCM